MGAHVEPARSAVFIVSAMEGAVCAAKVDQDRAILAACFEEFGYYIKALRH